MLRVKRALHILFTAIGLENVRIIILLYTYNNNLILFNIIIIIVTLSSVQSPYLCVDGNTRRTYRTYNNKISGAEKFYRT